MPLIRTIQIYPESDRATKIGIWHITEAEDFFRTRVHVDCAITHPHKRLQHLAARYLLTALEPAFPLSGITISPSHKPFLPDDPYHFSLAHSGDYAVAIISRKFRVGIDVEELGSKIERLAPKFLGPDELDFLDKGRLRQHLTVCWSAKEAVYKWYGAGGVGFRQNMRLQRFPLLHYGTLRCLFIKDDPVKTLDIIYQLEDDFVVTWLVDDKS